GGAGAGGDAGGVAGRGAGRPALDGKGPVAAGLLDQFETVRPRVAWSLDLAFATVHAEVAAVFGQAIDAMRRLDIELAAAAPDANGAQHAFETLRAGQLHATYAELCERHRDLLSPSFLWNVDRGRALDAAQ